MKILDFSKKIEDTNNNIKRYAFMNILFISITKLIVET